MESPEARRAANDVAFARRLVRTMPTQRCGAAQKLLWLTLLEAGGNVLPCTVRNLNLLEPGGNALPATVRNLTHKLLGGAVGVSERAVRETLQQLQDKKFVHVENVDGMLTIVVLHPEPAIRVLTAPPEAQPALFAVDPDGEPLEPPPLRLFDAAGGANPTGVSAQKPPSPDARPTGVSAQKPPSPNFHDSTKASSPPQVATHPPPRPTGVSAQKPPPSMESMEVHGAPSAHGQGKSMDSTDRICANAADEELMRLAARIFAACGYAGDDGGTLWKVASLWQGGLLSEAEVQRAADGAAKKGVINPPGCFHANLARLLKERDPPADLNALINRVWFPGHWPRSPPGGFRGNGPPGAVRPKLKGPGETAATNHAAWDAVLEPELRREGGG